MAIPTNVASLMAVLSLNTTQFKAEAAAATGMMGAAGPIAMAALGMGAVVAGVGVVATKMAGDFQTGLNSLVTGAGESKQNLQLVSDGILQMAKDTGTSTKQLIDGMYMIESGGFHGAAGLAILKAAAEGAKVGSADLGTVADTVDTILKNFGENGALTATQATNALITTVANGKTHLEDLANSLSSVLPAGAAAGLGLKSVLGAMSTLTGGGINAAESATYLRQMIIALEAPSSSAKTALRGIGITTDELAAHMKKGLPDALEFVRKQLDAHGIKEGSAQYVAAIREISGGTRQMQAMLYLLGGEGTTQDHLKTLALNVGKIGDAASKSGNQVTGWALVQTNMNQQFDRAKEVAETLFIQLGQNLLPVMTRFFSFMADTGLPAIKNLVQWLTGTGNQLSWLRPILAVVAIAIGGALVAAFVAWAISAGAAAVATIAATWPILAIGAAIALLIAGIILLVTHWKVVQVVFQASMALLGQILGWLGDRFGELFGHIGDFVGGVLAWFGNLGTQASLKIHQFIDAVVNFFATLPDRVWAWLLALALKIGEFEIQAVNKAKSLASNFMSALESLPGKLLSLGENLLKMLARGLQNGRSAVVSALANIPLIGGLASNINNLIPKFAAHGGTFSEGEWGVVGENNPEAIRVQNGRAIITPLSGGRLAASPAGMGFGSGAMNGGPLVVQIKLDGRQIAQATVPHLHTAIRNGTGNRKF